MSMNPVIVGTEPTSSSGEPTHQPASNTLPHQNVRIRSDMGTERERKNAASEHAENSDAVGQDAVQVQREAGNQIVIKYLDHTGQAILQVPSAQLLRLRKAIMQALEDGEQKGKTAHQDGARTEEGVKNGH